jgi:Bacterial transcriptional activator domain
VPVRLVARAPGFAAEVDPQAVDWHRFQALYGQGRAAREAGDQAEAARVLRVALGLWRGGALADLPGSLDPVRAQMDDLRLAAAEDLAAVELKRGAAAGVVGLLGELSAAHPGRERLAGLLVRALHAAGRRDEAVTVYQRTRRYLTHELGLDPNEALEDAYQAMLAGTGPARRGRPPVVPAQLPADVYGFAGRTEHLARLDALLTTTAGDVPAVVISAVSGTAGVGKTALAVRWAHRVRQRFPDGQLYVNLRGFDPGGQQMAPAEAVRGFLDALEVPRSGSRRAWTRRPGCTAACWRAGGCWSCSTTPATPGRSGRCCPAAPPPGCW